MPVPVVYFIVMAAALRSRCGHYIFALWFFTFLFMVALCNRAHHIYFHPVVSFYLLSFYPRLFSAAAHWMSASTHGVALVRI